MLSPTIRLYIIIVSLYLLCFFCFFTILFSLWLLLSINESQPLGRPSVERSVDNTTDVAVSALSRTHAAVSVNVRRQVKAPSEVRRRHAMKAAISQNAQPNLIRSGTFNQWSSRSNGDVFGPPCRVNQAGSGIQNGLQPVLQMSRNTNKNRVVLAPSTVLFCTPKRWRRP